MTAVPGGKWGFLAVSALAFVILGSVLEGIPAIVLFGPLLFPIAKLRRRARSALRDGGDLRDGLRAVRAAVRRRLLRGVRDRPRVAGRRDRPRVAASHRAVRRAGRPDRCIPWISIGFLSS